MVHILSSTINFFLEFGVSNWLRNINLNLRLNCDIEAIILASICSCAISEWMHFLKVNLFMSIELLGQSVAVLRFFSKYRASIVDMHIRRGGERYPLGTIRRNRDLLSQH